jgi:protein transport protein SEC61 subunit gamma-like protein
MSVENSKVNKVEEKFQDWQDDIEGRVRSLQTGSYARILKMARKPSPSQFRQTLIVCGIGMLILGLFGFIVQALMNNVFPSFFNWLTGA